MAEMEKTEKYTEILREIDACFRAMKEIRPLSESEIEYFREEFSISTCHNSNAIEGNTFTYDETRLLLKEGIMSSARSFREHEEIVGYKQGFDLLYRAFKEKLPVNEHLITSIHACVLRGDSEAGQYRRIQNYIGDLFNVKYTPCASSLVPERMRDYTERLQSELEKSGTPLEGDVTSWAELFRRLASHHIEFERIHPFVDGNGRCGRLLLTYEIISLGLLPVDIRYEERDRYYAALASYESKEKYSTRPESKTEKMAKLLAECELRSMRAWLKTFSENS